MMKTTRAMCPKEQCSALRFDMAYERVHTPDFSAAITTSGSIYHLKGAYRIVADSSSEALIPANRSFRLKTSMNGDNGQPAELRLENSLYTNHDRVISEAVDETESLQADERLLRIYGQNLLALAVVEESTPLISPKPQENQLIPEESSRLCEQLQSMTEGSCGEFELGVFGSHQLGLNGPNSDLDLIAWTTTPQRQAVISSIDSALMTLGYTPVRELPAFHDYAERYAKRVGLGLDTGLYLAQHRLRWVSPEGTPTSLQCLSSDYDHATTATLVDNGLRPVSLVEPVSQKQVEVLDASNSHNFPRVWTVDTEEGAQNVISFNWAHQGMGQQRVEGERHAIRGLRVVNDLGHQAFVLSGPSDYLLPSGLLSNES